MDFNCRWFSGVYSSFFCYIVKGDRRIQWTSQCMPDKSTYYSRMVYQQNRIVITQNLQILGYYTVLLMSLIKLIVSVVVNFLFSCSLYSTYSYLLFVSIQSTHSADLEVCRVATVFYIYYRMGRQLLKSQAWGTLTK